MHRRANQGFALLIVLGMAAIAAILISSISYRHQLQVTTQSRGIVQQQATLLALSAESWARQILRDDALNNDTDSWFDDWAQAIPILPVEGGSLSGCVRDLQGRINVNNLQRYTPDLWQEDSISLFSSELDSLLNLFALLEIDPDETRAAAIVDWIDNNSEYTSPGSTEDTDYMLEDPPRLAAGFPLTGLDELAAVRGFSGFDVMRLRGEATALPVSTPVNVNTASPTVLMALSSLFDEFLVESVLLERPFDDLASFYQYISESLGYMTVPELQQQIPARMLSLNSEFFELSATINLSGEVLRLRSLMRRSGRNQVEVFQRDLQLQPAVISGAENAMVTSFDCVIPEWLTDAE